MGFKMMDSDPEELQFLGAFGILKESSKIMRSCARLLGAITLTLVLPLSLAILGHIFVSNYLSNKIQQNEIEYLMDDGSPAAGRALKKLYAKLMWFLVFEAAYLVFVCVFSLLSTAAVVYTVACMYTVKEMSYGKVMSVVPKVWKRLVITFLWCFIILWAYNLAFVIAVVILVLSVGADQFYKLIINSPAFVVGLIIVVVLYVGVYAYLSMVWQLASVISVLEEKYGLRAMQKSKDLIKGKRVTCLVLIFVYCIIGAVIGRSFGTGVLPGFRNGAGIASGIINSIILVTVLCFANLIGLLTQSVLYFVCKAYHHERIDKPSLSDHLEVYLGDYVPLKSSNILAFESAVFNYYSSVVVDSIDVFVTL
eukprot:Gb_08949 [translate_table: standard]